MADPLEIIAGVSREAADEPFYSVGRDLAALIVKELDAAGYVIVPKEPTEEMVARGSVAGGDYDRDVGNIELYASQVLDVYRAMLAASQQKGG